MKKLLNQHEVRLDRLLTSTFAKYPQLYLSITNAVLASGVDKRITINSNSLIVRPEILVKFTKDEPHFKEAKEYYDTNYETFMDQSEFDLDLYDVRELFKDCSDFHELFMDVIFTQHIISNWVGMLMEGPIKQGLLEYLTRIYLNVHSVEDGVIFSVPDSVYDEAREKAKKELNIE